jgi:UDP-N-acetylglucosamine 2-epimerase
MNKIKILTIFGTRPEAIKLALFIKAIEEDKDCISVTCATTQQKELQNEVLSLFKIKVDHDLDVMKDGQDLFHITESIMHRIKAVLEIEKPDFTVVQGDTTTAFVAALSSFYCQIPIVHIEAGLRTGNIYSPYPEEANRVLISRIASLHMAATKNAVTNLVREGITQNVFKVGNTIVDAVNWVLSNNFTHSSIIKELVTSNRKKILITLHRRENFGEPLEQICAAVKELTRKYTDSLFMWSIHPNPNIKQFVETNMAGITNLTLLNPVSYHELISLLNVSSLVLSDSGGIQEEACILGKNIIILRKETERPEVVESGYGVLAGFDQNKILAFFDAFMLSSQHQGIKGDIYGKTGVSKQILSEIKNFFIVNKNG